MTPPAFWQAGGWQSRVLAPVGFFYALAGRMRRRFAKPYRANVPVICVGNLTVGGAGKTPVTISLIRKLKEQGVEIHAVSRGYGGMEFGPHRVSIKGDTANRVGDEPLLLAAECTAWVARERAEGIASAVENGAEMVILDDGHQNPSFERDLSIVVVDGATGFGNSKVMPAGPLREPVAEGLSRADAAVIMGTPHEGLTEQLGEALTLRARAEPRFAGFSLEGKRVLAFAGIGRPEKFYDTVRGLGAKIVDSEAFPDHYRYSRHMMERLLERAASQELALVTTMKDMVKLPDAARGKVWPIPIDIVWEDEGALDALMDRIKR